MVNVLKSHHNELEHHVNQAKTWLENSKEGENTAFLSYAALELRFAIERLAVHYWATLCSSDSNELDLQNIKSFERLERKIYDLGGHQKEINAHFEFMRVIMEEMKIDLPFHTPNIGRLSKYWHDCSELCHIIWPLSCSVLAARQQAHRILIEVASVLETQIKSLGWPILEHQPFIALRDGFVAGKVSRDDILAWVRENGMSAEIEFPGKQVIPHGISIEPAVFFRELKSEVGCPAEESPTSNDIK